MKLTSNIAKFLLLCGCFTLASNVASAATEGDYDGDGLADLAIIDADAPEGKTQVFVRLSSNQNIRTYLFRPFSDNHVAGNFFGNGKTYPGLVVGKGAGKALEWHIKNPSNTENVFNFGLSGDKIPNQGDLDCDGKTDYIVVRNENNSKTWLAKLSTDPNATHTTVFGGTLDRVFTADTNLDGCSEIVTLSPNFEWNARNFFGGASNQFKWGTPGEIPLVPKDLNGDGILEYISVGVLSDSQVAYVHSLDGGEYTVALGSNLSIPMIGNFFGSNTFGYFHRAKGRFGLQTPYNSTLNINFGNNNRGLIRPDGTVVTETEDGRFGRSSFSGSSGNTNSGSGGSGNLCDRFMSSRDGSGGFKNNPENSKGTMKIILPSSLTGKVSSMGVYKDDDKFDTLNFKAGNEWGNRNRFYGTKGIRSYPKNVVVVANLRDSSSVCFNVSDPARVQD
ncbi:MAG: hypothetical protein KBC84_00050 [Proteobacteria bacterium]|nr:hypothetical protein [Pseudomonadota bacterium]